MHQSYGYQRISAFYLSGRIGDARYEADAPTRHPNKQRGSTKEMKQ
jgi:hypothetical protein